MQSIEEIQQEVCSQFGSSYMTAESNRKVGIALETLASLPLNALRHPPEDDATGWYIWGGEELSDDPDFFQPLHVVHLDERCPEIRQYLGLAPGWRVLLAGDYIDVWYDKSLLLV